MKLKQTLQDKKLYQTSTDKISPLSKEKSTLINEFINALLDEDNCQLIFRGESISHSYRKSGIDENYPKQGDNFKFCVHGKSIFYIGSKADSYLFNFNEVDFPINLNNTDKDLFDSIYKEFKENIDHQTLEKETEFKHFFDEKTAEDFTQKILNLEEDERVMVKYYYLWLLHVIGETSYKSYSNFLSTTKDYETANDFGNDELVYVGWIPRPIKKRAIYLGSLIQFSRRLKKLELPTYSDEPYPDENEISLIGGLFPHYIFGIYHQKRNLVLVNNYLLESNMLNLIKDGLSSLIIKHGIGINQSNFSNSEFLKISKYKRYLTYLNEKDKYIDHE
jgi:hypothetical protein